jgi:signal transduction histidine kinase
MQNYLASFAFALFLLVFDSRILAENMQERSVIILPNDLDTEFSGRVEVFADPGRQLTVSDVTRDDFEGFTRNRQAGYSPGVFSGHLWIRFTVKAESEIRDSTFLQLEKPLLDVRFYQLESGRFVEQRGGRAFTPAEESINSTFPVFRLQPPATGELKTYYVMIRNDGVHSLSLAVRTSEGAWSRDRLQSWFAGFASGVILIMICYNLFLFLSTRETDFFWYSLSVLFLHYGHIGGSVTNSIFYTGKLSIVPEIWIPLSKILGTMCLVQFTRIFLRTRQDSRWVDRILLAVNYYSLVMLISFAFLPAATVNALDNVGAGIGLITCIFYSGVLFARGNKYARFYFIAWFPMLLVAMLYVFIAMTARGYLLQYIPTILVMAAMVEVLLLSMALADKINVLRAEKQKEEALARARKEEADRLHHEEILRINASLEVKVQEKTADIRALLDNLPLAVLTVEQNGTVGANISKHAADVLGNQLHEGDSVLTSIFDQVDLGADQKSAMMAAICASVGSDSLGYIGNELYFVRRFVSHRDGKIQIFEADWSPIEDDKGQIRSLLLCIKDVTETEGLRAQALAAETRGRTLSEILLAGSERVVTLLHALETACVDYVPKIKICLEDKEQRITHLKLETIALEFFRVLHTQKALTRSLKLMALADGIHHLEDVISRLREGQAASLTVLKFSDSAAAFQKILDSYQLSHSLITSALQGAATRRDEFPNSTVGYVIQDLLQSLPEIASAAGKPIPKVQVFAPLGLELGTASAAKLKGMLLHLLRNSMDHGIETPETRQLAGKSAEGLITLEIRDMNEKGWIRVLVADDGMGFNADLVVKKALKKGLSEAQRMPAEEILFLPGFSSKEQVTDLSGRGVGLDAVRADAKTMGGDARAILKDERMSNGNQALAFEITLKSAS